MSVPACVSVCLCVFICVLLISKFMCVCTFGRAGLRSFVTRNSIERSVWTSPLQSSTPLSVSPSISPLPPSVQCHSSSSGPVSAVYTHLAPTEVQPGWGLKYLYFNRRGRIREKTGNKRINFKKCVGISWAACFRGQQVHLGAKCFSSD